MNTDFDKRKWINRNCKIYFYQPLLRGLEMEHICCHENHQHLVKAH